jgi:hypothetical protein
VGETIQKSKNDMGKIKNNYKYFKNRNKWTVGTRVNRGEKNK